MSYTQDALRTESRPGLQNWLNNFPTECHATRMLHGLLGVQSEAGELADALKRTLYYGQPIDRTNLIEEIGDLCWYLAILADACGTTLEHCQARNIAKLRQRYPEKFTEQGAAVRDLGAEREALEA